MSSASLRDAMEDLAPSFGESPEAFAARVYAAVAHVFSTAAQSAARTALRRTCTAENLAPIGRLPATSEEGLRDQEAEDRWRESERERVREEAKAFDALAACLRREQLHYLRYAMGDGKGDGEGEATGKRSLSDFEDCEDDAEASVARSTTEAASVVRATAAGFQKSRKKRSRRPKSDAEEDE